MIERKPAEFRLQQIRELLKSYDTIGLTANQIGQYTNMGTVARVYLAWLERSGEVEATGHTVGSKRGKPAKTFRLKKVEVPKPSRIIRDGVALALSVLVGLALAMAGLWAKGLIAA